MAKQILFKKKHFCLNRNVPARTVNDSYIQVARIQGIRWPFSERRKIYTCMLGKKIHSEVVDVFPSAIYQLLSHACNIETIALLCKPKIVPKNEVFVTALHWSSSRCTIFEKKVQSMFLIRTVFSEVSIISLLIRKLLYEHIDFF